MNKRLLDVLVCPVSKGQLVLHHDETHGDELWSRQAALAYPIRDGIPVLLEEEARELTLAEVESSR